jgi:hypothetical protein
MLIKSDFNMIDDHFNGWAQHIGMVMCRSRWWRTASARTASPSSILPKKICPLNPQLARWPDKSRDLHIVEGSNWSEPATSMRSVPVPSKTVKNMIDVLYFYQNASFSYYDLFIRLHYFLFGYVLIMYVRRIMIQLLILIEFSSSFNTSISLQV